MRAGAPGPWPKVTSGTAHGNTRIVVHISSTVIAGHGRTAGSVSRSGFQLRHSVDGCPLVQPPVLTSNLDQPWL